MEKIYKENVIFFFIWLLAGIVWLIAGYLQMVTRGAPIGFFMGPLFIIVGFVRRSMVLIELTDTAIAVKIAPVRPRKEIPYSQIKRVERFSDKKVFLYYDQDGGSEKLKLPLSSMAGADRRDFLSELEKHVKVEQPSA